MQETIVELWSTAKETAVTAGNLIRTMWHQPRQVQEKGYRDFFTDADLAAQASITDTIRQKFPHHGFLAEEKDSSLPKVGDVVWIIDPIDGTTNYSRQQPIFCVSIAAMLPIYDDNGNITSFKPAASAIYDPMQDELFHAARGHGAWLHQTQLQVSKTDSIAYAVIGLDWSFNKRLHCSSRDFLPHFGEAVHGVRSLGSATLGLAWVANGRYDAYLNCNLRPWDLAAAYLLIEEAGGMITDIFGQPCRWNQESIAAFASNGRIHQPFLNLLPRQT